MKITVFITCLFLILAGCEKDDTHNSSIVGYWELREDINGFSGRVTNYAPGNGFYISFSENTYERYIDKKLVKSGTFQIVKQTTGMPSHFGDYIVYDNGSPYSTFLNIKSDTLITGAAAYDGPSAVYIRLRGFKR